MASVNPIRYRGYYYDTETGFYYLANRYYDPEIGRFINADDASNLGANSDFANTNLFAYCGDNPVNRADVIGGSWGVVVGCFIGGIVGGIINGTASIVDDIINGKDVDWKKAGKASAEGAIGGVAASEKMGVIAAGVYSGIKTWQNSTGTNKERFVKSIVSGATTIVGGFTGYGITKCFGGTVTSEFLWGHALTDINTGSATTIISEAAKSLVNRSFAEGFCGFIDRTGLALYRMEGVA